MCLDASSYVSMVIYGRGGRSNLEVEIPITLHLNDMLCKLFSFFGHEVHLYKYLSFSLVNLVCKS